MTSTTIKNALLVFVAYLVGAWLGFHLVPAEGITSLLWPPNAILTAAFLLTPPRRWWIYVAAALPAHVWLEAHAGLPWPLVLALFATNCSEALIGAGLVHIFSDAPARFDRLRRTAIFCASVVLAGPFLSSFLDAALVQSFRGDDFWTIWSMRFHANVLTQLTLTPLLVALVRGGRPLLERVSRQRLEAVVLVLTLGALNAVLPVDAHSVSLLPVRPQTLSSLLLPLLLWAAIRFGTHGASFALFITASVAVVSAAHGHGPLGIPSDDNVLGFQIFLGIVGIPHLCLGALVEERYAALHSLRERLQVEAFLARTSAAFVHLPSDQMDAAFTMWLEQVVWFFGLASARLVVHGAEEAKRPKEDGLAQLRMPLASGDKDLGYLLFTTQTPDDGWSDRLTQRLGLVTQIFSSALARKMSEDDLRASEVMKSAILSSLSSLVAVLDHNGTIIAVNEQWARLAQEREGNPAAGLPLGAQHPTDSEGHHPVDNRRGLKNVLDGSLDIVSSEVRCITATGEHWYATSIVPLRRPEGGAVISHTETTERKRAEAEALRSRQELAHFLRVSTMGALTTSLAHELNQPLAAILANAEAARMQLDGPENDPEDLREVLSDIMAAVQRAGTIIRGLRDLLRKGNSDIVLIDANELIRGIVKLLGSDALTRKVQVQLDLEEPPPLTTGDRIQLQQAVLNLMLNAMDAAATVDPTHRTVVIRTDTADGRLRVSVRDFGPGLREELVERVFEPFFTTKATGMGMGLAITRSIVEAHYGTISAHNNPDRGALFEFSLPLAKPSDQIVQPPARAH